MRKQQETRNHKKTNKREKGITLVALVVTIIILLILAGVTISAVAGNQSLFKRAEDASNSYQKASANELSDLDNLGNSIDKYAAGTTSNAETTFEEAKQDNMLTKTSNTAVTIGTQTVKIPAKFKIASDSSTTVAGGIVIEDASQNQYVWIPVDNIADYQRTSFKEENITSYYTETMSTDEYNSVNTNKGYYIGRYEAGIVTARTSDPDKTKTTMADLGEVIVKTNVPSYTYITRDQAKSLSEEMKTHYDYSATTKLCSSYAWDTALKFIEKMYSTYPTNSIQGNYYGNGGLKNTGLTTEVCNIYDLGGNVWEWTTEAYSNTNNPCVTRGGSYYNNASNNPAGYRNNNNTTYSYDNIGFRLTLYL